MKKRKSLTKKQRFEVFKRDNFTCQYCGCKAPDSVLNVDHIKPVSKGGTNDTLNLITSCFSCNSGKSDRELKDTSVIDKKYEQLKELQERREQIEMMMEWEQELIHLKDYEVSELSKLWASLVDYKYSLTDLGIKKLQMVVESFGFSEALESMKIAANQYIKYEKAEPTKDSVDYAFAKIYGIAKLRSFGEIDDNLKQMYYIRGILRNRMYCDDKKSMYLMKKAAKSGGSLDKIQDLAATAKNWTEWRSVVEGFIGDNSEESS